MPYDVAMMRRTALLGGIATMLASRSAFSFRKATRTPLPQGGSIILTSDYKAVVAGEFNHDASIEALIAYRKHRSTLAGSWECDGMVAISHDTHHENLRKFVQSAHGALTTSWAYADLKPGWFGGEHHSFPIVDVKGPHGPELERELAVHVSGFWDVYDKPARMFAMHHRERGLMIAIWMFDSHGGLRRARRMALEIAKSFVL